MKYVVPQNIVFTSTNALDETLLLTAWNGAATYNTNDVVYITGDSTVKYKYAGIDGTNTTNNPSISIDNNEGRWFAAPTNQAAMIDGVLGTQTENADTIQVTFNAVNIDSISFFNVDAESIDITMVDNTTSAIIYDKSFDMTYDELADFGDYLYSEKELRDALQGKLTTEELQNVIDSMTSTEILNRFTANPPIYYDVSITISINKAGGIAKCGYLAVGRQRDLGLTLWEGASTGIMSFSKKERNQYWGTVELVKGETADIMSLNCILDNATVDIVKNRLKAIDGIPCVFIGDDSGYFNSLLIYGFFLDFEIPLNPTKSIYNLKIESLV